MNRSALFFGIAASLFAQAAMAGPYTIKVSPFANVYFGQKEQDFKELLDQDLSFYMLRIGGGVVFDNFQLAMNADWSINDADVSEEEEQGKASRSEYDLSLGYSFNRTVSVFSGYKFGQTKIDLAPRDVETSVGNAAFQNRFEEAGPYLGVSFRHNFEEAGALSFSLAYAWLDAENVFAGSVDESDEGDAFELDDFKGVIGADAQGIGVGLGWSKRLTTEWVYQAAFKLQRYQQDLTQNGTTFRLKETFTEFGMGLIYYF